MKTTPFSTTKRNFFSPPLLETSETKETKLKTRRCCKSTVSSPAKLISAMFLLSMGFTHLSFAYPAGDREPDVNAIYPSDCFIQNGGNMYDITNPPGDQQAAVPNDGLDDTEAFKDALDYHYNLDDNHQDNGNQGNHFRTDLIFYVPDGVYNISDMILHRYGNVRTQHIRWIGQSRNTILRLDDNCPGFGDPDSPKVMMAFNHPNTRGNNYVSSSVMRNFTINTGSGNPGAIGLFLISANLGDFRNLKVRSGDGSGRYGIWMKHYCVEFYCKDITVEGFDYGIYKQLNVMPTAFEYLTLKNQKIAGISMGRRTMLSLRKVKSDQSAYHVPAIVDRHGDAHCYIVDSELIGGNASSCAIEKETTLFARNVSVSGYGQSVKIGGVAEAYGNISEFVAPEAYPANA